MPIATFLSPFTAFEPAFAQRALLAVLLVAVAAGALGGTIVLRDLPFFTHAVGTGAYPVMVVGVIAGVSLAVAALVGTLFFALVVGVLAGLGRRGRWVGDEPGRRDALIGLAVAGALALGTVLASSAGGSDARLAVSPEALLFGSVLTVSVGSLIAAFAATVVVALTALAMSDRWLAAGFDPPLAQQLRSSRTDLALLGCVALAVGAALPVTGSLLAGALLIAPAATARIVVRRASALPGLTFGLAAAEGVLGLYLALCFDLPAGAAIAGVAGVTFLAVAAGAAYRAARPAPRLAATMVLVALGAVVLAGCGSSSSSSSSDEEALKIVATTPQIADIVRNVGGDAVKVTQILPPGADPHEYEPKPSAVAAIADADIVFRSGGDVDAWLAPAVKAAGGDATQVDLSRAAVLLPAQAGADGADDKNFNAHWYLAPDNVIRASSRTRDELIKADPEARETFRANAAAYSALATDAQTALTKCSNRVPDADRKLLAGHNDFNYLANAFGFEIAAQLAENGEAEPSASDLQTAVDDARAADVTALVASKGEVTALAEQTASKLNIPLLQLYADSLTKSGVASTLLGAIGYDVAKIVDATSGGKVSCPSSK